MSSSSTSVESDFAHHAGQDDCSESTGLSRLKRHYSPPEGPEEAVQPHSSVKKQKLGAVPRVNWNAGTKKATIRTSLKGGDSESTQKVKNMGRQTTALAEAEKCQKTFLRLKRALGSVPNDSLDNETCKEIQKQIHFTKVDTQYCLNFPLTKEYEPLFSDGLNADITRGARQPLWDVVEQCMADGTLKDLKFGTLDPYLADKGIQLQPRLLLSSAPQASHNSTPPKAIDLPGFQVAVTDHTLTAPHGTGTNGEDEIGSNISQDSLPYNFGDPEPEALSQTLSNKGISPIPEPESRRRDHSEESEGGVVLNLTSNDHESGEISENSQRMGPNTDEEETSSKDEHEDYPIDIRGGGDSSPDDAMMEYSNADQAMDLGRTGLQPETNPLQSYQPSTLAELRQEDLREQVRSGHVEDDCELMWRTSGLPEHVSLANTHLKKPMGTSTWTRNPASSPFSGNQLSIRSKGEMTIKGRAAQQRQPIPTEPTAEDDRSTFVRSKVPAPTKTGHIRIEAPLEKNKAFTWTPSSSRHNRNPGYSSFPPNDQRPNVPRHAENGYDSRTYAHQPPLPQEPLPSRRVGYSTQHSDRGESYRPMPSAGQNAWRKHRM
ncbi:MAG: hypothetical protein Q9195_003798 [Heterodermia aff. obscurata]